MPNRRAIVLHLDAPTAAHVDEIRARWDPVMAARIGPHITVVHDVVGADGVEARLAAAAAAVAPFTIELTVATLWGPARYGIYLAVADPDRALLALYDALADLETPTWARVEYRPHVTLVHGRTVTEADADAAWTSLDGFVPGWPATISAIDLVELVEPRWRRVASFALGG